MTAKNIEIYTIDDVEDILKEAVDAVAGEDKAWDLSRNYTAWVTENYWHRYDKENLQITLNAQRYKARLRAKQTRDKAMDELVAERDALVDECEANRAELGLSIIDWDPANHPVDPENPGDKFDPEKVKDQYGLSINDERDINIPLEWEEVRTIGGSSRTEKPQDEHYTAKGYPVIDVAGWFKGGHKDRNITQQDLDSWVDEIVTLLEDPVANTAKIAMRIKKEEKARRTTIDAVDQFIKKWDATRDEINGYKANIRDAKLYQKQIGNIRNMITDLLEHLTGDVRPVTDNVQSILDDKKAEGGEQQSP